MNMREELEDRVIGLVSIELRLQREEMDSMSGYATIANWDSLAQARIVMAIMTEFNIDASRIDILLGCQTIKDFASAIDSVGE